jgi:hypothetical protein
LLPVGNKGGERDVAWRANASILRLWPEIPPTKSQEVMDLIRLAK